MASFPLPLPAAGADLVSSILDQYEAGVPLWQRVPARDEHGQRLSDFQMVFPDLRSRAPWRMEETLMHIGRVLHHYRSWVVFADLNLRTTLLWVSIRPRPGLTLEIPGAILELVPSARLLAPLWQR